VARRAASDERQADIFGATLPEHPSPERTSPPQPKPRPEPAAPPDLSLDALAERLSPADLEGLAAAVSDEALARLALAAVRQLRRRLARAGGRSRSKRPTPALARAARQIAVELEETSGGDEA